MVDQVSIELVNTVAALGTPGAAVLAAAYLARKLDAMTTRLLDTMNTTVDRNTAALAKVESVLGGCPNRSSDTAHLRRRQPSE